MKQLVSLTVALFFSASVAIAAPTPSVPSATKSATPSEPATTTSTPASNNTSTTSPIVSMPSCQIDQATKNHLVCSCGGSGSLTFIYKDGQLMMQCLQ